MTHRLATLVAVATAFAALPAIASAATMKHVSVPMVSEATIMSGPSVAAGDDNTMDIANAERAYLAQVCPGVLAHPGSASATLVTFCQQSHG